MNTTTRHLIGKHFLTGLSLAAALITVPAVADTPQIINGGMELQTASMTFFNQSTPNGWTLLVPSGEGYNSLGGAVSPAGGKTWGTQYLTGWGDRVSAVGIQQTIAGLTVGNSYEIDFYSLAAVDYTPGRWNVSFGSDTQSGVTTDATFGWRANALTFIATSSSQVLSFAAEFIGAVPGSSPPVLLLDGVTLKDVTPAVPEASTLAMTLAGLVAFGFIARRRANGRR